jgi:hypothetical protein
MASYELSCMTSESETDQSSSASLSPVNNDWELLPHAATAAPFDPIAAEQAPHAPHNHSPPSELSSLVGWGWPAAFAPAPNATRSVVLSAADPFHDDFAFW